MKKMKKIRKSKNEIKKRKIRQKEKKNWDSLKNDKIEEKRKIAKLDKIEFDKMLKMNEIE